LGTQTITGLLLAWLVVTIPTFIFILPVCVIWLGWRKKAWRQALVLALVVMLCVGAWTARNLIVLGAPVFVSTNSGENLLLGNSPLSSVSLGSQADISEFRHRAAELNLGEVERDRFYHLAAVEYIRSDPLAASKLYVGKFLNYFNYRNNLATQSEASVGRDLIMLVTYYPMLLMGAWRTVDVLFVRRSVEKNADNELLFAFLYLGSALVHALFFTRIRFRLPYDTLVIILAALFLESKLRQLLEARRSE
jgi:hypothetical protein